MFRFELFIVLLQMLLSKKEHLKGEIKNRAILLSEISVIMRELEVDINLDRGTMLSE